MTKVALYRHYDADGHLLYAGISKNPMGRMTQHAAGAQWFESVAKITLEWFADRDSAIIAEGRVIDRKKPKNNKHPSGAAKTEIIKFRISTQEKAAWQACADREGLTLSQYIRWVITPLAKEPDQ